MKKIAWITFTAVLALLLIFPTTSLASVNYKDVKSSHWAYGNIAKATEKGYFKGYPNNTFRPSVRVSRAEALATVVRALGLEESESSYNKHFPYDKRSPWAHGSIGAAIEAGIIDAKDYGMWFNPANPVPRAEVAKWFSNALVHENSAYSKALDQTKGTLLPLPVRDRNTIESNKDTAYVATMMGTGLMVGDVKGYWNPKGHTTRAEMATVLLRLVNASNKSPSDYLHLQELMEVGATGTNVETITVYRVFEGNEFTKVRNKPITLTKGGGTVKLHRLIFLDAAKNKNSYKSIYARMFIGPNSMNPSQEYYDVFVEKSIQPTIPVDSNYYSKYYAQGSNQHFVSAYNLRHGNENKYGLNIRESDFPALIKRVGNGTYWEVTDMEVPNRFQIGRITTDDRSEFFFQFYRGE